MEILGLTEQNISKYIGNLFRLEKETKANKDRILRDIKKLFQHQEDEENYYEPVRVSNFWNNSYIKYESSDEINKQFQNFLIKLDRIEKTNQKIISKKSDTWKIQFFHV